MKRNGQCEIEFRRSDRVVGMRGSRAFRCRFANIVKHTILLRSANVAQATSVILNLHIRVQLFMMFEHVNKVGKLKWRNVKGELLILLAFIGKH